MKLNYNNVDIIQSCFNVKDIKAERRPEIVFVGRSNVGKSSMINAILSRKSFARVSSVPGKTAAINFYDIDKKIYLVDLPGYGFAKRSKAERHNWGKLIGDYLSIDRDIRLIVFLVDLRHDPSENDMIMYKYLMQTEYLFTVAATKSDKLSNTAAAEQVKRFSELFGINVIPFSSQTKAGLGELKQIIEDVCETQAEPKHIKTVDYTILEEIG
ncbi:MAG: YihA family ribosome biogenesis GTP-binding protein [Clostridiales bacterium]|nr:MAG: YihA family ribosome biogenesis GTP-binding protein [Clostridiales bacterium]